MIFRKALTWSVAQTFTRLIVGFIGIKVTAVFLGPAGLAVVGQLSNFLSMTIALTGNGIQTAVTKMTAEKHDSPSSYAEIWSTGLCLALLISAIVGLSTASFSRELASWLFLDNRYWPVLVLSGFSILAGGLNGLFTGILNGLKRMHALSLTIIGTSVIGLVLSVPLVYFYKIWGGLVGSAIALGSATLISGIFLLREVQNIKQYFSLKMNKEIAYKILKFYPMLFANVISSQATLILVRHTVSDNLGLTQAGIWQASQRSSDMYTAILISALSLFLMPHLSSIKNYQDFRKEMFSISLKVSALTIVPAMMIFLLRDWVIALIFTQKFSAMRELFAYQLIGDVLMVAAWPLRMGLVIKMRTIQYMWNEFMSAIIFWGGTCLLVPLIGLRGVPLSYSLSCATCLIMLIFMHLRNGRIECGSN